MSDRPQHIEAGGIQVDLDRFNLVKALRSLYTRSNNFLKQILAQVKNRGIEKKKDNPLSRSRPVKTPITNKSNKPRIKEISPVPDATKKKLQ